MSTAAIIGTLAALAGVTAFVPQAWRIIRTRDVKDLSTPMWVLQVVGFSLWIAYGFALGELPIIIPNSICLLFSAFILVMILLPAHKRNEVADAVESIVP